MSGPSQRAAERRASRSAASGTRSAGRGSTSSGAAARQKGAGTAPRGRVGKAAAAVRERPTLTGRAVILAAVLGMVVLTLAVPLRELVAQRAEINALRADNDDTQARVDELTVREERLQDAAYVTSLIRERLHYVLPGQVGYVVLDPQEAPAPVSSSAPKTATPWYSTVWQSVREADGATTATPPKVS